MGPKGLATGCLGRMRYEYSERDIYNQLVYFAGLWDTDKAKESVKVGEEGVTALQKEQVLALAEHNKIRFATVKGAVDKYLDKCGRRWVAMDTLFGKLGFAAAV